jgi:biopolymer transport protein ExbD
MDFERRRRSVHELNLTALIDIVFHLMVFVMLTTSFVVSESLELSLPSVQSKPNPTVQALRLQLASDGTVLADGQPMDIAGLNRMLAARIAAAPDTKIAIFTTPGVSVQQLVRVMDAVYLTGGRNVQVDKVGR